MEFQVTTDAFADGAPIPSVYTCQGRNISPPLSWEAPPATTASFAVIVTDPDAPMGTWTHWLAWNIPPSTLSLAEGAAGLPAPWKQGRNDFKRSGYGGPCPPPGHGAHRYFFTLYALDTTLDLPISTTREQLEKHMEAHILARAQIMGKFSRE